MNLTINNSNVLILRKITSEVIMENEDFFTPFIQDIVQLDFHEYLNKVREIGYWADCI